MSDIKHERPSGLFVIAQALGILAALAIPCGLAILAFSGANAAPALVIREYLGGPSADASQAVMMALLALVGACLVWLLVEFVLLCGRLRKETAFTAANARCLGRIALAFLLGGVVLLAAGGPLMDFLLMGLPLKGLLPMQLLPSFMSFTAALMVRGVQVLLRRAVEMQTEQELTV